MKDALLLGNLRAFADIMLEAWRLKMSTHPHAKTPLIDLALQEGALAGKLLGAGDGGHVVIYAPPEKKKAVTQALEHEGGICSPIVFTKQGLETWTVRDDTI
jgi:D-glycero-alpha-D-manno-heptose-7-phosphate kinase